MWLATTSCDQWRSCCIWKVLISNSDAGRPKVFVIFFSPARQKMDNYLKLGDDCFFPQSF